MKRPLLLAGLLLAGLGGARAQSPGGSWAPLGARLADPRTLLPAAALPAVRASLAALERLAILASLWGDVQGAPPGDNSSSGRRQRAAEAKTRPLGHCSTSSLLPVDRRRWPPLSMRRW